MNIHIYRKVMHSFIEILLLIVIAIIFFQGCIKRNITEDIGTEKFSKSNQLDEKTNLEAIATEESFVQEENDTLITEGDDVQKKIATGAPVITEQGKKMRKLFKKVGNRWEGEANGIKIAIEVVSKKKVVAYLSNDSYTKKVKFYLGYEPGPTADSKYVDLIEEDKYNVYFQSYLMTKATIGKAEYSEYEPVYMEYVLGLKTTQVHDDYIVLKEIHLSEMFNIVNKKTEKLMKQLDGVEEITITRVK